MQLDERKKQRIDNDQYDGDSEMAAKQQTKLKSNMSTKKKTPDTLLVEDGGTVKPFKASSIFTTIAKEIGVKKGEVEIMFPVAFHGGDLDLSDDLDSAHRKLLNAAFKKLKAVVVSHNKLTSQLNNKKEEEKAIVLARGKTVAMATGVGYAKSEALIDAAMDDLQHVIGDKFKITATGLTSVKGSSFTEVDFANVIATLASGSEVISRIGNSICWSLGDAILLARKTLGESVADTMVEQVIESSGRQKHTVVDALRIAEKFPASKRYKELSFTHHQELANYEKRIDPEKLQVIIEVTLTGENTREIVTPSGKKIKQARPLSCAKMRKALQEAAGATDEAEPGNKKKTPPKPSSSKGAGFIFIMSNGDDVFRGEDCSADDLGRDDVAYAIDISRMVVLNLKGGKVNDYSDISILPSAEPKESKAVKRVPPLEEDSDDEMPA